MIETKLYVKQLLDEYKIYLPERQRSYTVRYRFDGDEQDRFRMFSHNEGIDFVVNYINQLENKIDELENKIDNLQHVEKIIKIVEKEEK